MTEPVVSPTPTLPTVDAVLRTIPLSKWAAFLPVSTVEGEPPNQTIVITQADRERFTKTILDAVAALTVEPAAPVDEPPYCPAPDTCNCGLPWKAEPAAEPVVEATTPWMQRECKSAECDSVCRYLSDHSIYHLNRYHPGWIEERRDAIEQRADEQRRAVQAEGGN